MITCAFEDGGKGLLRHVTADAIVTDGGKILLVKRAHTISEGGKYCLPGGFLNRDEIIIEALIREVEEESGYESQNPVLFRINDNPNRRNEDRQNISFTFFMNVGEKISESDYEVTEVKWFDLNQLPSQEEMAFDHLETIELYKKYLTEQFNLPILNK